MPSNTLRIHIDGARVAWSTGAWQPSRSRISQPRIFLREQRAGRAGVLQSELFAGLIRFFLVKNTEPTSLAEPASLDGESRVENFGGGS